MNKVTRDVIRTRTFVQGQGVSRETVLIAAGHRLQVRIDHNVTQTASSATVKRWSGAAWERVASIPPTEMLSWRRELKWSEDPATFSSAFDEDEATLIRIACRIIGVAL